MKKILFLLFAALAITACGNNPKSRTTSTDALQEDRVEVLVFYGKQRCPTCRAIESRTREVVESDFAEQLERETVVFRVIEIDADEALADKYEITWSSLLVVDHKDGVETFENLTEFAFANARNNPEEFKDSVKRKIGKLLE